MGLKISKIVPFGSPNLSNFQNLDSFEIGKVRQVRIRCQILENRWYRAILSVFFKKNVANLPFFLRKLPVVAQNHRFIKSEYKFKFVWLCQYPRCQISKKQAWKSFSELWCRKNSIKTTTKSFSENLIDGYLKEIFKQKVLPRKTGFLHFVMYMHTAYVLPLYM